MEKYRIETMIKKLKVSITRRGRCLSLEDVIILRKSINEALEQLLEAAGKLKIIL